MSDDGVVVCLDDFERHAARILSKSTYDYFRSGSDDEVTLKDNSDAFNRYLIYPRVLRDVCERDTRTTVLGRRISFPVCVAPTAFHQLAHPDGELAVSRACSAVGTAFTLSTLSSYSIEEVAAASDSAAAAGGGLAPVRFFQLYVTRHEDFNRKLVEQAERAGYSVIVLTVDGPVIGTRRENRRNRFIPRVRHANFEKLDCRPDEVNREPLRDPGVTWSIIDWLRSITKLPIVIKGILTVEDAVEAARRGVEGIIVSNHGGRQLDTVPATIDVVSDVVRAVDGRCEVFLDGGVRTGTHVFKALALGARAVFIGRPAVYALAYNGEDGVKQMLQILKNEFSLSMALAGCVSVEEINSSLIRQRQSVPTSKL